MSYQDTFKKGDRVWIMMKWGPWAKATVMEASRTGEDGVRLLIDNNQSDQVYRWNKDWVSHLSALDEFAAGI